MIATTVTISKTDSNDIDNMNVNQVDTNNVGGDKNVGVDYSALPQGEKDIIDAFYVLMASKVPA